MTNQTYESWRISFQNSEQAARVLWGELKKAQSKIGMIELQRDMRKAERDGANERVQLMLNAKNKWMERAIAAEKKPTKKDVHGSIDVSDIEVMVVMLEAREWADHAGKSELGKRLEACITDLHNEIHEAKQIPKGFAVVPVEPTPAMQKAALKLTLEMAKLDEEPCHWEIYGAMVAAAPKPDVVHSAQRIEGE